MPPDSSCFPKSSHSYFKGQVARCAVGEAFACRPSADRLSIVGETIRSCATSKYRGLGWNRVVLASVLPDRPFFSGDVSAARLLRCGSIRLDAASMGTTLKTPQRRNALSRDYVRRVASQRSPSPLIRAARRGDQFVVKRQFVRPRIALPYAPVGRATGREESCEVPHGLVGWLVGAQRDHTAKRAWCARGVQVLEVSSFN